MLRLVILTRKCGPDQNGQIFTNFYAWPIFSEFPILLEFIDYFELSH